MGICYWCHWGWPKPISDIFKKAEADIDALEGPGNGSDRLEYGPSHIVWSDENWEDSHIDHCLEKCGMGEYLEWPLKIIDIVARSLRELKKLPLALRTTPDAYEDDDDNPQLYPPPAGQEMVKGH